MPVDRANAATIRSRRMKRIDRIRDDEHDAEADERARADKAPVVPPGISNAGLARWAANGRTLQRQLSVPAGLSSVRLEVEDIGRAQRGDVGGPGPTAYRSLTAGLSAAARERLNDWIADGPARRFTSKAQLVAALECKIEITDPAELLAINWVTGLGAWGATEPFLHLGRDVASIARTRLKQLLAGPAVTRFASRAALKAALLGWAQTQLDEMLAAGVRADELDVAIAMYARLDQAAPGAEAILHKLEFARSHHAQYQGRGVNEATASNTGLVYGPWRAPGTRVPTAGPQQVVGSENVHTMPLNVAWLLACCHHEVTFRLYSPLSKRAMLRPQGSLSALARELAGLVEGGFYEVSADENQPVVWPNTPGFNQPVAGTPRRTVLAPLDTTTVLRPTARAKTATMASLTVASNRTWDNVRTALNAHGLHVEENPSLDASLTLIKKENENFEGFMREFQGALARAAAPQPLDAYNSAIGDATFYHQTGSRGRGQVGPRPTARARDPGPHPAAGRRDLGAAGARALHRGRTHRLPGGRRAALQRRRVDPAGRRARSTRLPLPPAGRSTHVMGRRGATGPPAQPLAGVMPDRARTTKAERRRNRTYPPPGCDG